MALSPDEIKARKRAHYRANRDAILTKQKAYNAANREQRSAYNKRVKSEPIERIWGRPRPLACEICNGNNNGRPMYADHDHQTGAPRLFLCCRCNVLEGHVKKEWGRLTALIAYHLWCDGYRALFHVPVAIKDNYPTSPVPSVDDIAWIRRVLERAAPYQKRTP